MSASNRSTLGSYVTQPSDDAEDEDSLVNFTGEQQNPPETSQHQAQLYDRQSIIHPVTPRDPERISFQNQPHTSETCQEPRAANFSASSVRVDRGDGSRIRIVNAGGTGGAILDGAGIVIDGGCVSIRKDRDGSQTGSSRYPVSDVPQKPKMHENFEYVVNSVRSLGYTEERILTALNSLCSKNVEISMDKLLDELEDLETTNN